MNAILGNESALFWVLALFASFLVGASKGGLPLVGALAVPILAFVMPAGMAAGLTLPIYILSDLYGLWIYRREYDAWNIKLIVPAAAVGVGIGFATAHQTNEDWVKVLVAVIALAYCIDAISRNWRTVEAKPADVPRGLFWGAVAGFTSFVSHTGAPPYNMFVLPQRLPKMVYAGTTTIIFAIVNWMKLPPYWILGQVNISSLEKCLVLGPVALAGVWAGYRLTSILPEKLFFRAVEITLFIAAVVLLRDAVPHLMASH